MSWLTAHQVFSQLRSLSDSELSHEAGNFIVSILQIGKWRVRGFISKKVHFPFFIPNSLLLWDFAFANILSENIFASSFFSPPKFLILQSPECAPPPDSLFGGLPEHWPCLPLDSCSFPHWALIASKAQPYVREAARGGERPQRFVGCARLQAPPLYYLCDSEQPT